MASNRIVVSAELNTRDFERGAAIIIQNFDRIAQALSKRDVGDLRKFGDEFKVAQQRVNDLSAALQQLTRAQAQAMQTGRTFSNRGGITDPVAQGFVQKAAGGRGTGQQAGIEVLGRAIENVNAQLVQARERTQTFGQATLQVAARSGEAWRLVTQEIEAQLAAIAQIRRVSQTALQDAGRQGANRIQTEIQKLQDQARQIEQASQGRLTAKGQSEVAAAPALIAAANKHREKAAQIEAEISRLTQARQDATRQGIVLEGARNTLLDLQQRRTNELAQAEAKVAQARAAQNQSAQNRQLSGADKEYQEVQSRIAELRRAQEQFADPAVFARLTPALRQYQSELKAIRSDVENENLSLEFRNKRSQEGLEIIRKINQEQERITQRTIGQRGALDDKQLNRALTAQIPGINALFQNVFNDLSRRFVATLQFAISGALIFGVQQFAREFIQTAIEVERAFADIETALEFDIEAPRGSAEFSRQVEEIRQEVLLLANEFNVLPTEANKTAFVMVSRFSDMDNALKATRAQLLATKISTIDQMETLRSLTAVAEAFAASQFDVNDGLTIQEKLLKRESISADLYGRVLDDAVLIQQKFGVEVEDVQEGTARAAETFRQMGFSLQETEAIVASVSRQLGQTGQQSAERLVRSLGQLSDPKIREELLALAQASDAFTLNISDFEDGATAWKAIADQIERVERADPTVAQRILQIVGQRRELEAVAAALGTTDLQSEIVRALEFSAGAAEDRFDVLARTVSELIASIATRFQELSQNFEQLGGISSLNVLLQVVDRLIGAMNTLLKVAIDIKEILNGFRLFGAGFGDITVKVVSLSLALATTYKVAKALLETFQALALTSLGSTITGFFGRAGVAAAPAIGTGINSLGAAAGANVIANSTKIGALATKAGNAAVAVGAMSRAAVGFIPVWGQIAIVAGTLIVAHKRAAEAIENFATVAENTAEDRRDARFLAERQIRQEGIDPQSDQASLIRLEADLEALRANINGTQSGRPGIGDAIDVFGRGGPLGILAKVPEIIRRRLDPEGVAGSSEQMASEISRVLREYIQASIDGARDDLGDLSGQRITSSQQVADIAAILGRRVEAIEDDPISDAYAQLLKELDKAQTLLDDDGTRFFAPDESSPEDFEERAKEANSIAERAIVNYNDILSVLGGTTEQLIASTKEFDKGLSQIDTQVFIGKKTREEAEDFIRESIKAYQDQAAALFALSGTANDPLAEEALDKADNAIAQLIRFQSETINEGLDNVNQRAGEYEKLKARRVALVAAIRRTPKGPVRDKYEEELAAVGVEILQIERDQVLAALENQRTLARTFEERDRITSDLIRTLRRQADERRRNNDQYGADALDQRAAEEALGQENSRLENAIAGETARIRLAAPALSSLAGIRAQISAVKTRLAAAKDPNDFATLMQELRELEAQFLQEELARLTALTLLNVSVRDSIGELTVTVNALSQEVVLAAEQYGVNSKEWADAVRNQRQALAQLQDALIELDSLNRQLADDYDVTDPLDKALEDYIRAAQALQVPDLGPAERAAREVEFRNAEAARIAAEFENGLFNLRFQFERGDIGTQEYIAGLRAMLAEVDTSTRQGKELWIQINGLIESMTEDISNAAFNIPGQIRLPTLFEVRRAVQAEALGVNYLDNRQQNITVNVSSEVELAAVLEAISNSFDVEEARLAPGGAGITIGGF